MNTDKNGASEAEIMSKCRRKAILSVFFILDVLSFTFSLVAIISPSWQYAFLENGRTEHHHGLWLDCKRDYSPEYGRSREYYETLYRLEKQQGVFYQYFLPPLNCVYKFDYYIDYEDLYDHNHDENKLQDDANQHLFLAWKIATLVALGFAVILGGTSLLICICAFCHRTFISASTVLVTIAALLSTVGLFIFYIWGNYQDNNIIKEDDGVYEQYFGWAFYAQIIGTSLYFLASFFGCIATSVAFKKAKAKLVKIEVIDDDNSHLLRSNSPNKFKRSFSAVYRVDSAALRHWEKDYMSKILSNPSNRFKRTNSVPNVRKSYINSQSSLKKGGSGFFIEEKKVGEMKPDYPPPSYEKQFKSSFKQAIHRNPNFLSCNNINEVAYESLMGEQPYRSSQSEVNFGSRTPVSMLETSKSDMNSNTLPKHGSMTLNVYDNVCERVSANLNDADQYEEPNSSRFRNNTLSTFKGDASNYHVISPSSIIQSSCNQKYVYVGGGNFETSVNDFVGKNSNTNIHTFPSTSFCGNKEDKINIRQFAANSDILDSNIRSIYNENEFEPMQSEDRISSLSIPKTSLLSETVIQKNLIETQRTDSESGSFPPTDLQININTFNDRNFRQNRLLENKSDRIASSNTYSSKFTKVNHSEGNGYNSLLRSILSKPIEEQFDSFVRSPEKKSFELIVDETDRSVGSTATISSATFNEPELRLNLFNKNASPSKDIERKATANVTTV